MDSRVTGIPFTFHKGIEILAVDRNIYRAIKSSTAKIHVQTYGCLKVERVTIKVIRYFIIILVNSRRN